jgi:Glycosyl hydrolase family 3 C terminal domain.
MDLPVSHNKLVSELLKVNENVIVLLVGGSPVTLPWNNEIKALLNLYLGGQSGGEAACRLLFGDVSPSGKLAETYPKRLEDNVNHEFFPMGPRIVEYRESIFVGYRYFDAAKKEVRYPFGFGLSYTDFEYSNLKLSKKAITETELNNEGLKVSFTVKNVGRRKGAEIAQVYVKDKVSTVFMPEKALFGFDKVVLEPDEEKTIEVTLNARAFSFYDIDDNHWSIEQGEFEILVGKSSRDIVLSSTIDVTPDDLDVRIPDFRISCPVYYNLVGADTIQQEEFEVLCGVKMPENKPYEQGEYHINCTVGDVSETKLGTRFLKLVSFAAGFIAKDSANKAMILQSVRSMPIRALNGFTGGLVSKMATEGLLEVLNKEKGGWKKIREGLKKENRLK